MPENVLEYRTPETQREGYSRWGLASVLVFAGGMIRYVAYWLGMAMLSTMLSNVPLWPLVTAAMLAIGTGLGVAGVFDSRRNRMLAVVGLVLNGGMLLLLCVVFVIVLNQ